MSVTHLSTDSIEPPLTIAVLNSFLRSVHEQLHQMVMQSGDNQAEHKRIIRTKDFFRNCIVNIDFFGLPPTLSKLEDYICSHNKPNSNIHQTIQSIASVALARSKINQAKEAAESNRVLYTSRCSKKKEESFSAETINSFILELYAEHKKVCQPQHSDVDFFMCVAQMLVVDLQLPDSCWELRHNAHKFTVNFPDSILDASIKLKPGNEEDRILAYRVLCSALRAGLIKNATMRALQSSSSVTGIAH